jgi:hypothetical protein
VPRVRWHAVHARLGCRSYFHGRRPLGRA